MFLIHYAFLKRNLVPRCNKISRTINLSFKWGKFGNCGRNSFLGNFKKLLICLSARQNFDFRDFENLKNQKV